MKTPSKEFVATLGEYAYAYMDPITGKRGMIKYAGKGEKHRGLSHIKSKDYDYNNLYLLGRNLEKFNKKPALLLESFMINWYDLASDDNFADNKIAGHYKECFKFERVIDVHEAWLNSQRNYRHEGNKLLNRMDKKDLAYNVFVARPSKSFYIDSPEIGRVSMRLYVDVSGIKLTVGGTVGGTPEWKESYSNKLIEAGYEPDHTTLNYDVQWVVSDINEALGLWKEFLN